MFSGKLPKSEARRSFLVAGIYAIWTVIAACLAVPGFIYLWFPPKPRNHDEWVDAGSVASLAPNEPVQMVFRRNRVDGWKVTSEKSTAWVVRFGDQGLAAFGPQCTHLGCAYHWDATMSEFICPCHNSVFAIDGRVLSGPAERPLDRYRIKLEGSRLLIGNLQTPEDAA